MFWTDWGSSPKIERALLDGSDRRTIVASGLGWPNALVLDTENSHLYWADAYLDVVETSGLDGAGRTTVSTSPHIFGMSIYGLCMFWYPWYYKHVKHM